MAEDTPKLDISPNPGGLIAPVPDPPVSKEPVGYTETPDGLTTNGLSVEPLADRPINVSTPSGHVLSFKADTPPDQVQAHTQNWWDRMTDQAYTAVGHLIPHAAEAPLKAGMDYYVNPANKALNKVGDLAVASVQAPKYGPKTSAYLRSQGVNPDGPMPEWLKGVNDESIRFAAQTVADPRMWPLFGEKLAVEAPAAATRILNRALAGAVATNASKDVVNNVRSLAKNWSKLSDKERSAAMTGGTLSAVMAGLSGYHSVMGSPVAEHPAVNTEPGTRVLHAQTDEPVSVHPPEPGQPVVVAPEYAPPSSQLARPQPGDAPDEFSSGGTRRIPLTDLDTKAATSRTGFPVDDDHSWVTPMGKTMRMFNPEPAPDLGAKARASSEATFGPLERRSQSRPVTTNGSGDSAASQEAINRVASDKAHGVHTYRVDSRSGKPTPLIGVDAVDAKAGPHDHIVQIKGDQVTPVDSGKSAKPLDEPGLMKQLASKRAPLNPDGTPNWPANYVKTFLQKTDQGGSNYSDSDLTDLKKQLGLHQERAAEDQTPEFDKWFGKSAITDNVGQPLRVYHGTRSGEDFKDFSTEGRPQSDDGEYTTSGSGADPTSYLGAHFAEEPQVANKFANRSESWMKSRYEAGAEKPRVIPAYLNIEKPKVFTHEDGLRNYINQGKLEGYAGENLLNSLMRSDGIEDPEEGGPETDAWMSKYDNDPEFRADQHRYLFEQHHPEEGEESDLDDAAQDLAQQAKSRMKAEGHDGITYKNSVEGGTSHVAFEPKQIRNAISEPRPVNKSAQPKAKAAGGPTARVEPASDLKARLAARLTAALA